MITDVSIMCFLSLTQTLNFTRTAGEMSMTQQSVSQNISKLEAELGFPLFKRDRKHVEMTMQGMKYQAFLTEVTSREKELRRECETLACAKPEVVFGGFQDWTLLGPAANLSMALLRQRMPNVSLEISRKQPGVLIRSFLEGELQLIMVYERWAPHDPGINVVPLQETEYLILVSSDNPLATTKATYENFISQPYIADNFGWESYADTEKRMRRELNMLGFTPSRLVITSDREAAYTAAEMGRGCVLASDMNRILGDSNLVGYPTGLKENLVCVWRSNASAATEAYAHCLIDAYKEKPFMLSASAKKKIRRAASDK